MVPEAPSALMGLHSQRRVHQTSNSEPSQAEIPEELRQDRCFTDVQFHRFEGSMRLGGWVAGAEALNSSKPTARAPKWRLSSVRVAKDFVRALSSQWFKAKTTSTLDILELQDFFYQTLKVAPREPHTPFSEPLFP